MEILLKNKLSNGLLRILFIGAHLEELGFQGNYFNIPPLEKVHFRLSNKAKTQLNIIGLSAYHQLLIIEKQKINWQKKRKFAKCNALELKQYYIMEKALELIRVNCNVTLKEMQDDKERLFKDLKRDAPQKLQLFEQRIQDFDKFNERFKRALDARKNNGSQISNGCIESLIGYYFLLIVRIQFYKNEKMDIII